MNVRPLWRRFIGHWYWKLLLGSVVFVCLFDLAVRYWWTIG